MTDIYDFLSDLLTEGNSKALDLMNYIDVLDTVEDFNKDIQRLNISRDSMTDLFEAVNRIKSALDREVKNKYHLDKDLKLYEVLG